MGPSGLEPLPFKDQIYSLAAVSERLLVPKKTEWHVLFKVKVWCLLFAVTTLYLCCHNWGRTNISWLKTKRAAITPYDILLVTLLGFEPRRTGSKPVMLTVTLYSKISNSTQTLKHLGPYELVTVSSRAIIRIRTETKDLEGPCASR